MYKKRIPIGILFLCTNVGSLALMEVASFSIKKSSQIRSFFMLKIERTAGIRTPRKPKPFAAYYFKL